MGCGASTGSAAAAVGPSSSQPQLHPTAVPNLLAADPGAAAVASPHRPHPAAGADNQATSVLPRAGTFSPARGNSNDNSDELPPTVVARRYDTDDDVDQHQQRKQCCARTGSAGARAAAAAAAPRSPLATASVHSSNSSSAVFGTASQQEAMIKHTNIMATKQLRHASNRLSHVVGHGDGEHLQHHYELFEPFVSNLTHRCLMPDPISQKCSCIPYGGNACVIFVDVSGYSKLSAKLAPKGAHALSEAINGYFERILDVIIEERGDVLKFAGDAIVAAWPTVPSSSSSSGGGLGIHGIDVARNGTRCALQLQYRCGTHVIPKKMLMSGNPFDDDATNAAAAVEDITLHLHVGVGYGILEAEVITPPQTTETIHVMQRSYFFVSGQALADACYAVGLAKSTQIATTKRCFEETNPYECPWITVTPVSAKEPDYYIVNGVCAQPEKEGEIPQGRIRSDALTVPRLQEANEWFVPPQVVSRIATGLRNVNDNAEIRGVVVFFIQKIPEESSTSLWFHALCPILAKHNCPMTQVLQDDKGTRVVACLNLFVAESDAADLAITIAYAILREMPDSVIIGMAQGFAFCGIVGSQRVCRWEIAGEAVVRACRVCEFAHTEYQKSQQEQEQHRYNKQKKAGGGGTSAITSTTSSPQQQTANINNSSNSSSSSSSSKRRRVAIDGSLVDKLCDASRVMEMQSDVNLKGAPEPITIYTLAKYGSAPLGAICAFQRHDFHRGVRTALRQKIIANLNTTSLPISMTVLSGASDSGQHDLAMSALYDTQYVPVLHLASKKQTTVLHTMAEWFAYHPDRQLQDLARQCRQAAKAGLTVPFSALAEQIVFLSIELGLHTCIVVDRAELLDPISLIFIRHMLLAQQRIMNTSNTSSSSSSSNTNNSSSATKNQQLKRSKSSSSSSPASSPAAAAAASQHHHNINTNISNSNLTHSASATSYRFNLGGGDDPNNINGIEVVLSPTSGRTGFLDSATGEELLVSPTEVMTTTTSTKKGGENNKDITKRQPATLAGGIRASFRRRMSTTSSMTMGSQHHLPLRHHQQSDSHITTMGGGGGGMRSQSAATTTRSNKKKGRWAWMMNLTPLLGGVSEAHLKSLVLGSPQKEAAVIRLGDLTELEFAKLFEVFAEFAEMPASAPYSHNVKGFHCGHQPGSYFAMSRFIAPKKNFPAIMRIIQGIGTAAELYSCVRSDGTFAATERGEMETPAIPWREIDPHVPAALDCYLDVLDAAETTLLRVVSCVWHTAEDRCPLSLVHDVARRQLSAFAGASSGSGSDSPTSASSPCDNNNDCELVSSQLLYDKIQVLVTLNFIQVSPQLPTRQSVVSSIAAASASVSPMTTTNSSSSSTSTSWTVGNRSVRFNFPAMREQVFSKLPPRALRSISAMSANQLCGGRGLPQTKKQQPQQPQQQSTPPPIQGCTTPQHYLQIARLFLQAGDAEECRRTLHAGWAHFVVLHSETDPDADKLRVASHLFATQYCIAALPRIERPIPPELFAYVDGNERMVAQPMEFAPPESFDLEAMRCVAGIRQVESPLILGPLTGIVSCALHEFLPGCRYGFVVHPDTLKMIERGRYRAMLERLESAMMMMDLRSPKTNSNDNNEVDEEDEEGSNFCDSPTTAYYANNGVFKSSEEEEEKLHDLCEWNTDALSMPPIQYLRYVNDKVFRLRANRFRDFMTTVTDAPRSQQPSASSPASAAASSVGGGDDQQQEEEMTETRRILLRAFNTVRFCGTETERELCDIIAQHEAARAVHDDDDNNEDQEGGSDGGGGDDDEEGDTPSAPVRASAADIEAQCAVQVGQALMVLAVAGWRSPYPYMSPAGLRRCVREKWLDAIDIKGVIWLFLLLDDLAYLS